MCDVILARDAGGGIRHAQLVLSMRRALISLGVLLILLAGAAVYLTQPVFPSRVNAPQPSVDPVRLRAHVETLAGMAPRDWEHVENLDRAAEYIRGEFAKSGGRVSDQTFGTRERSYRNIVVRFGPESGERVVVGAHYDAFSQFPGADDNASGVAALIELAFLLGRQPPATTVELVAFTLEEPPFFRSNEMGSAIHALELDAQHVSLRAMVCLEMVGYFSDDPDSQHYPAPGMGLLYPKRGNFIAVVGNTANVGLTRRVKTAMLEAGDLPIYSINAPALLAGIDFSDHLNYWEHGFPAVMVSDTAFYRNPGYHRALDTPEKLDYVRLSKVVQQVHYAVRKMASN